ncbi:Fis1 [Trypanosoma melophagium]|uniref:Fis1 n=1 Tax=Trypanosoma melophagium TaxID=715481 RepID=UPI00351A5A50|nr:Fis1 [Trypanosoma melophagium]
MDGPSDILELFSKDPNVKHILSPSREELRGLDEAISRLSREYDRDPQNHSIAFEYATLMISHSRRSYIEKGLSIMELLGYSAWKRHWETPSLTDLNDTVRMTDSETLGDSGFVRGEVGVAASAPPERLVEKGCSKSKDDIIPISDLAVHYYYLAIGWIKLQKLDKAEASVNHMLQLEPEHRQGIALKHFINAEMRKARVTTGLASAGVVAAAAAVACLFLRRS